jgi:hypothetical protein
VWVDDGDGGCGSNHRFQRIAPFAHDIDGGFRCKRMGRDRDPASALNGHIQLNIRKKKNQ